ncbi:uncharacterized protein BYT42DRAFT_552844 [Radiomyces spectabilis]|uniref:uncharacterized protein n=1 Tax=Radiomyces spectabilis TaxID=64574 RepID=UPI0022211630|nr:uncharacterized protein BYT42DRAFT_552844 [Radiomyces spectabilis]KAI8393954.1 hypothetical protein BYT42DRAFT_552844 [Radiomyces spectabilis]
MAPPPPARPLSARLFQIAKTQQFAWFIGHALTLLGSLFHFISIFTLGSGIKAYKIAYAGALLSYGVVIYKSHGAPQFNAAYAQRLVMDENMQYLLLALYWFVNSPITVTLIPFFTFSTFHALGYIRTNLIPAVFPAPRAPAGQSSSAQPTWQAKLQQQIKAWTDKNYGVAMRLVAQAEVVVIAGRLLLGLFRLHIVPIFLFAQFLRFRYHLSTYTKQAFTDLRVSLDRLLLPPTADPRIPSAVGNFYTTVKSMIIRYGDAVVQRQPGPQQ